MRSFQTSSQAMTPVLSAKILCHYTNDTDHYQVIRISNIPCWFFERAVFPGDSLTFIAFPTGLLEVHTGVFSSSILSDIIPCDRLATVNSNLIERFIS
jgi:hypothetical protein